MSGVDVFISYKSERRAAARHLAKVLECYGYSVWYDYGLIPGEDFEPRLMAELAGAKACVVLWCEMAVASEWVAKEARTARETGRYLPCWIQKAALPAEFAGADTIDLTAWDGEPASHTLHRLLADIGRRVGREPTPSFAALRELDESWRTYGAPSLASFALSEAPEAMREAAVATAEAGTTEVAPPSPPPPAALASAAPAARLERRTETWEQMHAFQAVPGDVQTVIWSPDGQLIAAEGTDSSNVTVWDPIEGRGVAAFPGPSDEARPGCLAFSPDGELVAAGYGPSVHIFDARTGDQTHLVKTFAANVCALHLTSGEPGASDPLYLVTADVNGGVHVWNCIDGERLETINVTGGGRIMRVALTTFPHGVFTADYDSLDQKSHWFMPEEVTKKMLPVEPLMVAPKRDDRSWWFGSKAETVLWAADYNTALELCARGSSKLLERWNTDRHKLVTLRTSEAGRFMMIVEGAKLKVWSAEDGRELATIDPDGAWVRAAEFSPDGTMIATGDSRGAVRVWRLSPAPGPSS